MADQGDLATDLEQRLRDQAVARRGLASRVTEIPPPHYGDDAPERDGEQGGRR